MRISWICAVTLPADCVWCACCWGALVSPSCKKSSVYPHVASVADRNAGRLCVCVFSCGWRVERLSRLALCCWPGGLVAWWPHLLVLVSWPVLLPV